MLPPPTFRAGFPLGLGFGALLLLVAGAGFWSVQTQIAGAVVASGTIVVENNRQAVQHVDGGVVQTISARDGVTVQSGDLLVELDASALRSDLAVVDLQLIELRARRARLEAERDGHATMRDLRALTDGLGPAAQDQAEGQRVFFAARKETFEKELGQVGERIAQTREQIAGATSQLDALLQLQALSTAELKVQEDAFSKGLTQADRVSALRREAAQLVGDIGRLRADIARLQGSVSELEIEGVRLQNARRETAIRELRDTQFSELELIEQRANLLRRIERLAIRAPVSGIVHGSSVFAQNAVVRPAETLMYIIPQDQPLLINAEVPAIHIDQVRIGQPATLRFSAFDQRQTPVIDGTVVNLSADVFRDDQSGERYYSVDLEPSAASLPALNGQALVPGMPVEVFIRTDERTPLSYLVKPLTDYFRRAFRGT